MADTAVTVVGAGVVGLAIAARLAPRFPDLMVLEKNERHGLETSSRNSEVIHAGMYYPTGSLKARLCVEGNRRLYELGARDGLPHRRLTKIVTAARSDELPELERLLALGHANGAELRLISGAESRALEPNVQSVAALYSPNSGIVNTHALMDRFAQAAREAGAVIQMRAELIELEHRDNDYRLTVRAGGQLESFTSERVVNVAGLEADSVAALAGIDVDAAGYRLHWCKGSYFSVYGLPPGLVSRLVYPVPDRISLGVHALVDLGGRLRFGPDAEYLPERRLDYQVDEAKRARFGEAVRRLVPSVRDENLAPDISGIRPKLQGPGQGFRDFVIAEETQRGLPGLVNVIGTDSPGLTASPAIAEYVENLLPD